jgi:hypothetical protein
MVTLLVPDPGPVASEWQQHLDYREVETTTVSQAEALAWDTPAMAGRAVRLLAPASGEPVFVRLIQAPADAAAAPPLRQFGWNAVELLVQDPDALAARLAGTAFRVIGPPKDLYAAPNAPRAMQVLAPGEHVLYLTRIIPAGVSYDLGEATSPVDRVFIVVVGGTSIEALRRFYGQTLGLPTSPPAPWQISVLATANGLPTATRFPLSVAELPRRFLVELDGYPATAAPRLRKAGYLPAGISMVSFGVDTFGAARARRRAPPARLAARPYAGREVLVVEGPAGEWLELVRREPDAAR